MHSTSLSLPFLAVLLYLYSLCPNICQRHDQCSLEIESVFPSFIQYSFDEVEFRLHFNFLFSDFADCRCILNELLHSKCKKFKKKSMPLLSAVCVVCCCI